MRLHKSNSNLANRAGAMLPMLAVVMVFLMVTVAIGVDIARMHVTRSELRTANDAAARAAVVEIGNSQNAIAAKDAAIFIASQNVVAGQGLTLTRDQIDIGTAVQEESGTFSFSTSGTPLTSARVLGQRCSTSVDGEVSLLFGPIFGVDSFCADARSTATQSHRDIALVLDVSGSMKGDRFEALGRALDSFLAVLQETAQDERISLTVYETSARKIQPLTSELSLLSDAFDEEKANGRTAVGLGMQRGLESLLNDSNRRDHAIRSMIVMTDGNHNEGVDPEDVVPDCNAAQCSVFTVTFEDGADQTRMKALAESADGFHIHADNDLQLEEAFESIARQFAVMLIE